MKSETSIKQQALGGMIWKLSEKMGMQVVQFIIQIVLARILLPEEYGVIGLLTIFITISDVFIQQGLTTALIQKKDADDTDFSSVYFANIFIALVLYAMLFFSAPYVAIFYNNSKLISLLRVLSLNVIFGAFGAVHNAILSKNLDFKKSFFRNCFNIGAQGIVGILTAYLGCGEWALVYSKISGVFIGTIVLCITVKWYPKFVFSIKRIKLMFAFSSKVLASNLLNTFFNNIHSLIIGKYYSNADLGYYQKGQQIPQTFMSAIDGSFSEVMYPTFSKFQNDLESLKKALRRSIKMSLFFVLPLLFGIIAISDTFVIVLLTEKWLPCVPFIRLQCIICMFWPLAVGMHALNALGKSGVTLKLSILTKVITLILLFLCVNYGIVVIMIGSAVTSLISLFVTAFYMRKYIGYRFRELIRDILPGFIISALMMLAVFAVGLIELNIYLKLIIQIIVGIVVYILLAMITKNDSLLFALDIMKPYVNKFLNKK